MLSSAQKAYIRHLVARHADESVKVEDGKGRKGVSLLSDRQIAEMFGIHYNTLTNWKHNREFQAALEKAIEQFESDSDYFATVSRQKVLDEAWAQYHDADTGAEKRQWWKEIERITSAVKTAGETVDVSDLTDDDLLAMALAHDVSVLGLSASELQLLAKKEGESCSNSLPESSSASDSSPLDSPPDGPREIESPSPPVKPKSRSKKKPSPSRRTSKTGTR